MNDSARDSATVFVVEDEPSVRQSVKTLVESKGLTVKEFGSAEEFLQHEGSDHDIGCIVAGVRLSGISGVELLEQLAEIDRPRPMVVIARHATTPTVVRAMRNGAVTVLDKPFDPDELWQAVREAIRADTISRANSAQIASLKERFILLTDQERVVLKLIVNGYINKQISKQLDVSVRTVESRRQQIFKKTGARNLGELMWNALMLRSEGFDWFTDDGIESPGSSSAPRSMQNSAGAP